MKHRRALLAAATIVAVMIAGVAAVSANIGILDNGDSGGVGELSAANVATTPEPRVIDAVSPLPTTAPAAEGAQEFAVEDAGVVTVVHNGTSIRVGDVQPAAGWTWRTTQRSDDSLSVTFTSAGSTLDFLADLAPDGSVSARIQAPGGAGGGSAANDGSGHDGDRDDHEDEAHERSEHEDRSHERYEGHDDDD